MNRRTLLIALLVPAFILVIVILTKSTDVIPTQVDLDHISKEIDGFSKPLDKALIAFGDFKNKVNVLAPEFTEGSAEFWATVKASLAVQYAVSVLDVAQATCMWQLALAGRYAAEAKTYAPQLHNSLEIKSMLDSTGDILKDVSSSMTDPKLGPLRADVDKIADAVGKARDDWPLPTFKRYNHSNGPAVIGYGKEFTEFEKNFAELKLFLKNRSADAATVQGDRSASPDFRALATAYGLIYKTCMARAQASTIWALTCDLAHNCTRYQIMQRIEKSSLPNIQADIFNTAQLREGIVAERARSVAFLSPFFLDQLDDLLARWRASLKTALASDGLTIDGLAANCSFLPAQTKTAGETHVSPAVRIAAGES